MNTLYAGLLTGRVRRVGLPGSAPAKYGVAMSTTVIASTLHSRLALFPLGAPALDVDALRGVLRRHGIAWVGDPAIRNANEFIAAQDLPADRAAALAQDLHEAGFATRVVNRTGLTGSRRVGNAIATQMAIAMLGVAATSLAVDHAGVSPWVLVAVLPVLLAIVNLIAINRRGGARLPLAGGTHAAPELDVAAEVARTVAGLPDNLAGPLVARASRLQEQLRTHPEGPAAQELAALLQELRAHDAERLTLEARRLREDVRQASRALSETE